MNTISNNIKIKVHENKTYILEILKIHHLEIEVPKQKLHWNATLNRLYMLISLKTNMTITKVCENKFRIFFFMDLVINSHVIYHLVGFYSHKSSSTV